MDSATKEGMLGNLIPDFLVGEDAEELKEWGQYFITFPSDILANTNFHSRSEYANEVVDWDYPKLCFFSAPLSTDREELANLVFSNNTIEIHEGGGHCIQWMFHADINESIWTFVKDRPGKKY